MLEAAPGLRPVAIFEEMLRRHPDLGAGIRRTLERRIRAWRALHGAEQEVIFRQVQEPGRLGLSDFTDMGDLGITIAGAPLDHRLYHFRLAYSRLRACPCGARRRELRRPGRGPAERALVARRRAARASHRQPLRRLPQSRPRGAGRPDPPLRRAVRALPHAADPQQPGVAHENGAIEGAARASQAGHRRALLLRGERDFDDLAAYRGFVDEIVGRRNARNGRRIDSERAALQPLPTRRACDYEKVDVRVTPPAASRCARCSTPCHHA